MNVSKGTFYGVVAVLMMGIVLSSSLAVSYYESYQAQKAQTERYVGELNSAISDYNSLTGSYNASLGGFRSALTLLADALDNLNTSLPAYSRAAAALPALWESYGTLASSKGVSAAAYRVSMKVDFGNGTDKWYNDTRIAPGWNGYLATLVLLDGRVDASWYPQYGEHFVAGLGGVEGNDSASWFVWTRSGSSWSYSPTGVDALQVYNGTVFAWTLCGFDNYYNPTCHP